MEIYDQDELENNTSSIAEYNISVSPNDFNVKLSLILWNQELLKFQTFKETMFGILKELLNS